MDRNLRSTGIICVILLISFTVACICVAITTSKIKDLQEELASAQALELAQDAYARGLQTRLENATKRTNETEILLNFCLKDIDGLLNKSCDN